MVIRNEGMFDVELRPLRQRFKTRTTSLRRTERTNLVLCPGRRPPTLLMSQDLAKHRVEIETLVQLTNHRDHTGDHHQPGRSATVDSAWHEG